jgi:hypothetical protein
MPPSNSRLWQRRQRPPVAAVWDPRPLLDGSGAEIDLGRAQLTISKLRGR